MYFKLCHKGIMEAIGIFFPLDNLSCITIHTHKIQLFNVVVIKHVLS